MSFKDFWQAILAAFGGNKPSVKVYNSDPRLVLGYESWAWLHWTDKEMTALASAMTWARLNHLTIPLFACTRLPDGRETDESGRTCYGYWHTHFHDLWYQSRLRKLMRTMWGAGHVVGVGIGSGNFTNGPGGITTCDLPDAWYHGVFGWLMSERTDAGVPPHALWILPVNELGHKDTIRCVTRQTAWQYWSLDHAAGSPVIWNGDSGQPRSLPAGFVAAEIHPQSKLARGPKDVPVIVLPDAPMRDLALYKPDGTIDTATYIPYLRDCHKDGLGVVLLDTRFAGGPDLAVVKAMKGL